MDGGGVQALDHRLMVPAGSQFQLRDERGGGLHIAPALREVADGIASGRTDYANLEAAARSELARHGWKVDYIAVRNGIGLRIPHPEGYDHPNVLIVLGAATLGTTRLIDNVDVTPKADGED